MRKRQTQVVHSDWAVQYRTYLGGKFERTIAHESEASARAQVERFNQGKEPNAQARLAHHEAGKWKGMK